MTSIIGSNTRRADLSVCRSGNIDISARIVKELDLRPGDVVDIDIAGSEFYFYVRVRNAVGSHNAKCFPTRRNSPKGHMRCHCQRLARGLLDKAGLNGVSTARFPCGSTVIRDGQKLITILTRLNLTKQQNSVND